MKIRVDRFVRHAEKTTGFKEYADGSSGQHRVHLASQMVAVA
jgi:hypothetical protein